MNTKSIFTDRKVLNECFLRPHACIYKRFIYNSNTETIAKEKTFLFNPKCDGEYNIDPS